MARLAEIITTPSGSPQSGSLQQARISKAPASLDEQVMVIIPAYSYDYEFGPCVWPPRGTTLPAVGDTCYVAFSGTERKPVVVAWEGVTTFATPTFITTRADLLALTPTDGTRVDFLVDATNGLVWHLRYRAASTSAYKWEYVGGAPLEIDAMTQATQATYPPNTWGSIGADDPSLTVPLAGDYVAEWNVQLAAFTACSLIAGLQVAGVDPPSTLVTASYAFQSLATGPSQIVQRRKLAALAANTVVKQRYQHNAGSSGAFYRNGAALTLRPVRVG